MFSYLYNAILAPDQFVMCVYLYVVKFYHLTSVIFCASLACVTIQLTILKPYLPVFGCFFWCVIVKNAVFCSILEFFFGCVFGCAYYLFFLYRLAIVCLGLYLG